MFTLLLLSIAASPTASVRLNNHHRVLVGDSYCTWGPQYDCYASGWPSCCNNVDEDCPDDEQPPCDEITSMSDNATTTTTTTTTTATVGLATTVHHSESIIADPEWWDWWSTNCCATLDDECPSSDMPTATQNPNNDGTDTEVSANICCAEPSYPGHDVSLIPVESLMSCDGPIKSTPDPIEEQGTETFFIPIETAAPIEEKGTQALVQSSDEEEGSLNNNTAVGLLLTKGIMVVLSTTIIIELWL